MARNNILEFLTTMLIFSPFLSFSEGEKSPPSELRDPAPVFMNPSVQEILKKVAGFDVDKVFRTRLGETEPPKYKLLTDKELKEVFSI